jgi:hypothetical protein
MSNSFMKNIFKIIVVDNGRVICGTGNHIILVKGVEENIK